MANEYKIRGTLQKYLKHPWIFLFDKNLSGRIHMWSTKEKHWSLFQIQKIMTKEFYTGVFGVYNNNQKLKAQSMIRYIEKNIKKTLFLKVAEEFTFHSNAEQEYRELIHKVYVPIFLKAYPSLMEFLRI